MDIFLTTVLYSGRIEKNLGKEISIMKSVKRQSGFARKLKRTVTSSGFRRLFPVLIVGCIILAVLIVSCTRSGNKAVSKAVARELDPLKNLDSGSIGEYISGDMFFSDTAGEQQSPDDIKDVFTMYFKDFDYKIKSVKIDGKDNHAEAKVTVKTPDSHALASDFVSSMLETLIMNQADDPTPSSGNLSRKERFLILHRLLSQNSYEIVSTDCTVRLKREGGQWTVEKNSALNNALVGGLITCLSDSEILSPKETLHVYLNTIKNMNIDQMANFMGLNGLLNSDAAGKNETAQALLEQIHSHFDFSIGEETINGYKASVNTVITTIDSDAILEAYQDSMTAYMDSPDALIDGADGSEARSEKSRTFLIEKIQDDSFISDQDTVFNLINDGVSWKLETPGASLSNALFGSLADDPK